MNKISLEVKTAYNQFVFNLSRSNTPIYKLIYKYFYFPKKGSLSHFIDAYSRNNKDIFVIQVGANDGYFHDPIHKFIKRDGWKGLLIEPQPMVFSKFLEPLHAHTQGITALNAALDYENGQKILYTISFSNSRWATGLASFNRDVLVKAFDSGHVKRCAEKEGLIVPNSADEGISELIIPTFNASTIINKYNIGKVNWLQVDTEGFDFDVLKIFQIEKLQPEIILFEHSHFSPEIKLQAIEYLNNSGYYFKHFGANTLAILKTIYNEYNF